MKLYKIYTEAKQLDSILAETEDCFSNFTVYLVEGAYMGVQETSMVIEIIAEKREYPLVKTLAESIKLLTNQDSVLITSHDVTTESV